MSNDFGYDGQVRPTDEPIGLELTRTGRLLSRAFDDELAAAGASLPVWLVLTALKRGDHAMQRELAAAVGIDDATLTHHLRRMEADGLVVRHRAPDDRRNQLVELTAAGEELFGQLLGVVTGFDRRLRAGFDADELAVLRAALAATRAPTWADAGCRDGSGSALVGLVARDRHLLPGRVGELVGYVVGLAVARRRLGRGVARGVHAAGCGQLSCSRAHVVSLLVTRVGAAYPGRAVRTHAACWSAATSSGSRWMLDAVTFSSRCATEPVPGIGSIAGERASSHAEHDLRSR